MPQSTSFASGNSEIGHSKIVSEPEAEGDAAPSGATAEPPEDATPEKAPSGT